MLINLLIIIFGLAVFEIISSIDNAVVNAHVLQTLPEKYRRLFLTWGLILAVFLVRGLLPLAIVWLANPHLGFVQIISFVFSNNPAINDAVNLSKPLLLLGGGIYLFLVAIAWLFMEEKNCIFWFEKFLTRQSVWFYAIASLVLAMVIFFAIKINPMLAFAATIGATAFFITDGFKKNAEVKEKDLVSSHMSALSKILYLTILDASFSIDGVVGAFAFTVSVPLILIGNGIGAWVVREFTIKGMDAITRFAYLKNGAMYSIGVLGYLMILESFGREFPFWLAPLNTIIILGIFLLFSHYELKKKAQSSIKTAN